MKLLSDFIFSILLLILPWISEASAQVVNPSDSVSLEVSPADTDTVSSSSLSNDSTLVMDSLKIPLIRRIELSLDYLKLVSFALPNETKMEGGMAIITKPGIGLSFEAGYGAKMPEDHFKNADYKVEGFYGRVGFSYHYTFNPGSNLFIGAKYGISNYQDEATYIIESSLWEPYEDSFNRTGLSARWAEFIAGSESRINGFFYMGFIFRFRALIQHDNFAPLEVFSIPGYGRTMDKTIPALNLYMKFVISFEK
jgi:hypothetical protein